MTTIGWRIGWDGPPSRTAELWREVEPVEVEPVEVEDDGDGTMTLDEWLEVAR